MECLICKKEENNTPNYLVPIYVLLYFYSQWQTHVDAGGVHYKNAFVFTPLGKTTIESYCCPKCSNDLNEKNQKNKKKSKIILISTLVISVISNYLIYSTSISGYYYLLNILFALIAMVCIDNIFKSKDDMLFDALQTGKLNDDIDLISKKIDFATISYLDLKENQKEMVQNKSKISFDKENLLFVKIKQKKIQFKTVTSLGNDDLRVWFVAYEDRQFSHVNLPDSFGKKGNKILIINDNLDKISISKNFKLHSKKESFSFDKYDKINAL